MSWNVNGNIDSSNRSPIFFSSLGNFLLLLLFWLNSVGILLLSSQLLLLASDGFNISGNEQVNHLIPFFIKWNLTSESHDFSGQHPEDHSDGFWNSVVAWNDNINEIQWSISVAKSNGWDVDIWSFNNSLSVAFWISNDQKSWFLEFFGQLIGKSTWNPSWWWASSTSGVLTEFIDSSLTVLFSADDNDFSKVRDWGNKSGSEFDFSVGFINSENVITSLVLFFNELFHVMINLVGSEMDLNFIIEIR